MTSVANFAFMRAIAVPLTNALFVATLVGGGCLVVSCDMNIDEVTPPPPPTRHLSPSGKLQRGPSYTLSMYDGESYSGTAVALSAVSFDPADGVVPGAGAFTVTFTRLGTYTITLIGARPALSSTVTVVDAATIAFDMSVGGNRDIYSQTLYGFNFARFTTNAADDVHPTVAGGMLIFTSYRDGNGELYSRSLVGSAAETRLTFTAANETNAELSPDGKHLVYVRDDNGVSRIWISDPNGANAARMTNDTTGAAEDTPRWYETSDYVLMAGTSGGRRSLFRVQAVHGSTPLLFAKPVTADSAYDSPDVEGLGSINAAFGAVNYGAYVLGTPRRIHMAPISSTGQSLVPSYGTITAPNGGALGEQRTLKDWPTVLTLFAADGSTTLGTITMTAPFPSFNALWRQIPTSGVNPRHATEIRP